MVPSVWCRTRSWRAGRAPSLAARQAADARAGVTRVTAPGGSASCMHPHQRLYRPHRCVLAATQRDAAWLESAGVRERRGRPDQRRGRNASAHGRLVAQRGASSRRLDSRSSSRVTSQRTWLKRLRCRASVGAPGGDRRPGEEVTPFDRDQVERVRALGCFAGVPSTPRKPLERRGAAAARTGTARLGDERGAAQPCCTLIAFVALARLSGYASAARPGTPPWRPADHVSAMLASHSTGGRALAVAQAHAHPATRSRAARELPSELCSRDVSRRRACPAKWPTLQVTRLERLRLYVTPDGADTATQALATTLMAGTEQRRSPPEVLALHAARPRPRRRKPVASCSRTSASRTAPSRDPVAATNSLQRGRMRTAAVPARVSLARWHGDHRPRLRARLATRRTDWYEPPAPPAGDAS